MPAITYVRIYNLANKTCTSTYFKKIQDAIDFVKSYPCRGHFVVASRYDEILAMKSDVNMSFGFHHFQRISKGHDFFI